VLNPKATPPSGKVTMAGKRFQVGSKVFLKKTGIPGIIQENQGSKTWKIELVDPNNGKPNSIYKDSVKSSDIRNLKEDEFPRSSEESAEQQQQQQKTKKKQTKKKDADESKEEEETEAFKEPKIKWTKSKARALLYQDIKEGLVPLHAKDKDGKTTMKLKDIYEMHPEYAEYDYSKFSSRVSGIRKIIQDCVGRAAVDLEAFNNFKANNPVSQYSHKGYEQWQGSEAQEYLREDMEKFLEDIESLKEKKKQNILMNIKNRRSFPYRDLWGSRSAYYENFPLDVFLDKVKQEIRTSKYLHTIEERGMDPRKFKDQVLTEQLKKDPRGTRAANIV
jgi:hypothetical protein